MKQLTGLDASFLYMETANTFGHVNAVGLYRRPDDPDYDPYEAFKKQVEDRLHLLEPFRRRLVEVPLGLDHPYWINDPDFDIEFHVRHIAIPPPGDMEQLATQVARIIGRPMDRTKPLWEAYVMEGLPDDLFAIFTKTHHATIDGAAGVVKLSLLLDNDPTGDEIPPDDGSWKPERIPTDLEMFQRTMGSFLQRPYRLARFQLNAAQQMAEYTRSQGLQNLLSAFRRQLPPPWNGAANDEELPSLPAARAPRTPFNGTISPHRQPPVG
ncbi:MAG: wax ester/triacylglycerol synthase domain-containing protein [Actinomycetota bacterium]